MAYPFVDVICPDCNGAYAYHMDSLPETRTCPYPACKPPFEPYRYGRRKYAQVGAEEATAVATRINPETGKREVVYCFGSPTDPIPQRYADQGFVKEQFHSLQALRSFCREQGVVNDKAEYDNDHEGYSDEIAKVEEEREKAWKQNYQRERELAERALRNEGASGSRRRRR